MKDLGNIILNLIEHSEEMTNLLKSIEGDSLDLKNLSAKDKIKLYKTISKHKERAFKRVIENV